MIGVLLLFPLPPRPHPSLVLIPGPQPPVAVKSSCRLRAAKRSFTPSTPLKKTGRRRVNGNKSRNGDETRGATAVATAKGSHECEAAGATVAEVFPTGLVVSKHFRESFTGREILMLEVEKVGEAEETCAAVFLFSVADAATPLRSVAPRLCVCVWFWGPSNRAGRASSDGQIVSSDGRLSASHEKQHRWRRGKNTPLCPQRKCCR